MGKNGLGWCLVRDKKQIISHIGDNNVAVVADGVKHFTNKNAPLTLHALKHSPNPNLLGASIQAILLVFMEEISKKGHLVKFQGLMLHLSKTKRFNLSEGVLVCPVLLWPHRALQVSMETGIFLSSKPISSMLYWFSAHRRTTLMSTPYGGDSWPSRTEDPTFSKLPWRASWLLHSQYQPEEVLATLAAAGNKMSVCPLWWIMTWKSWSCIVWRCDHLAQQECAHVTSVKDSGNLV